MARQKDPAMVPGLLELLRLKEKGVFLPGHYWTIPQREVLFYTIGAFGRGICKHLVSRLNNEDPIIARNTAFLLGYFCYERASDELLQALRRGDKRSGGAAFALTNMRIDRGYESAQELLHSDQKKLRLWAVYALREYGRKEAVPILKNALQKEEEKKIRKGIEQTINFLQSDSDGASKRSSLSRQEVEEMLQESKEENGLKLNGQKVTKLLASQKHVSLSDIEKIRKQTIKVTSDLGNKSFRRWSKSYVSIWRKKNGK